ncbi:MAG TPA: LEPR-XLL domain-containing protein, partial [Nitrospira sp.]|nr:LEPR-XLL domain-containing protein [Nitrospira sp.]
MNSVRRFAQGKSVRVRKLAASRLLLRLLARWDDWLKSWWQRRWAALQAWRASRSAKIRETRIQLVIEPLEPRVLMSADLGIAAAVSSQVTVAQTYTASSQPSINLTPLIDADGTQISLDLTGPGTAQLVEEGAGYALRVDGSDLTTQITLKASGGDGKALLTGIQISGHVGTLNLADATLQGDASFDGKLTSLTLGALNHARIDIAGMGDASLQLGRVDGGQIHAPLATLTLAVSQWTSTAPHSSIVDAAAIRSLSSAGEFNADLYLSGQGVTGYTLGNAIIGGRISGGVWSIHGRGSSLQADSTDTSWRANFSSTLVQFITKGDASGTLAVSALQLLQVGGSARSLTLLVGADLGDDSALGGTGGAGDAF